MYGVGDALMDGVRGFQQAEHDNGVREDREYRKGKRETDDAYQAQVRERNGIQWERDDAAYDKTQLDVARKQAVTDVYGSWMKSRKGAKSPALTAAMQKWDNDEDANIKDTFVDEQGAVVLFFDDGNRKVFKPDEFKGMVREQLNDKNLGAMLQGEEDLKNKTVAQKGVADHAANLRNPTQIETNQGDGQVKSQLFKAGEEYGDATIGQSDAYIRAQAKGSGSGNSSKKQLDMDKFFAQLASKQFGSPDANGNIMLDEKGGIQKSKVETLASTMYRKHGDALTPLQYFSRALKITRDNPALTKAQAVKKLSEMNIEKPGWFASKAEEKKYMDEVQAIVSKSESPTGVIQPQQQQGNGVAADSAPAKNPAKAKPNIITKEVPKGYADKMAVGKVYSPTAGQYKGLEITKSADGTIQLIK